LKGKRLEAGVVAVVAADADTVAAASANVSPSRAV
jgi:hypothetical protein